MQRRNLKTTRTISVVLDKEISRRIKIFLQTPLPRKKELKEASSHVFLDKEYRLFVTAIAQHVGHNTEDFLL